MTLAELNTALRATGYPVAYSHFKQAVTPPYIAYIEAGDSDIKADNHNYLSISNINVELYTDKKDLTAEAALQNKLKELEIPYRKNPDTWIEEEGLFQIIYEIQLIGE